MSKPYAWQWARGRKAWTFFRWALFAAALSLAFYLPYRYAMRSPTMPGLYGVAAVAILWVGAGMVCTPALARQIVSIPLTGLLATFQMLVQHVFLSVLVAAFVLKPAAVWSWFGFDVSATRNGLEPAAVRSQANV